MLTVQFDHLHLEAGCKILDVGCGAGRHIRHTRRYPAISAVALDVGEKEVKEAAESIRTLDKIPAEMGGTLPDAGPWMIVRGSVYDLPFPEMTFDRVIISEVLEHLHDDDKALNELSRVLKPGGILALSVPRQGPEAVCWALSRQYVSSAGGHVRIYHRGKLREKLTDHGFRIFASHFAHGLHSPYWWLKCLVGVERENVKLVDLYHRFLVWDLMKKPKITQLLEKTLNPLMGKSVVFYGIKQ